MDSVDIGIFIASAFFVIALAAAVLLPLINAIKHPAGLMKSLMGVGLLVVLFVVAYALSGSEVSAKSAAMGIDASGSKLVGAGLTMFYFVFILAAVGIIYSEINKAFK